VLRRELFQILFQERRRPAIGRREKAAQTQVHALTAEETSWRIVFMDSFERLEVVDGDMSNGLLSFGFVGGEGVPLVSYALNSVRE
jgi:hypothetical protein